MKPKLGGSFVELAQHEVPPLDLGPYIGRLRKAGATRVYVAPVTDVGVLIEASTAEVARAGKAAVVGDARRFVASETIESEDSLTAFPDALERVGCTNSILLQISTPGVATELMHPTGHPELRCSFK